MIYKNIKDLASLVKELRKDGLTITLSTGFFDLLHHAHENFLIAAKNETDILIIGIESDHRARKLKGPGRPFETQEARARKVERSGADHVILLPDNFDNLSVRGELMRAVKPDVFAVSENSPHQKYKRTATEKFGGVLKVVLRHNPDVSTSQLADQRKLV